MQFTTYCPNLRKIDENKISFSATVGTKSQTRYLPELHTVPQVEEILSCSSLLFQVIVIGFKSKPANSAWELASWFKI